MDGSGSHHVARSKLSKATATGFLRKAQAELERGRCKPALAHLLSFNSRISASADNYRHARDDPFTTVEPAETAEFRALKKEYDATLEIFVNACVLPRTRKGKV